MTSQEMEERLIVFGIKVIKLTEDMPKTPAGRHLADQLLRSGTSPALNYAEARAAETHRDFTHKVKVALKELRESFVNLRMTEGSKLHPDRSALKAVLDESSELVAIFTKSVKTAEARSPRKAG